MTPEDRAREVLAEARLASYIHDGFEGRSIVIRNNEDAPVVALDALKDAGLFVVPDGHAVIDGEVVALCARCGHDEWLHSITGDGYCVDACGCHEFRTEEADE